MNKSQSGFTLVELVVVILILGILSATALPRFMNVSKQAHEAAVAGAAGGLGAGVALVRAQWIANGTTGADVDVAGFGDGTVAVNTSGWPVGLTNAGLTTTTHCDEVWKNVMQNPPSAAAASTTTDYSIALNGTTGCTFTYVPATSPTSMSITYESTTGAITVDKTL